MAKDSVVYEDASSGLKVVIYKAESSAFAFKTYFNNIKVDISMYEFTEPFLIGLSKAIKDFLSE